MTIDVVIAASVATAIITLLSILWKVHLLLRKMETKYESFEEIIKFNTMQILKMTLVSENLPITDRLEAGEKYMELGGNGYARVVYNRLLKELEEKESSKHH